MYFSDKLSLFMKQRNMRIVDLAKLVDIKRPNVYKIVNGTRNLADKSYVKQFSDALQLTKDETNELYIAYEIDKVGSYVYFRRDKVEEILKLSIYWDNKSTFSIDKEDIELDDQTYKYYHGEHTINSILSHILAIETRNEEPQIKIYCQPDNKYLLNTIQFLGNLNPNLKITHLFGLDNSTAKIENEYYNLDYLLNLCPIIVSSINYTPYYYRTSIPFTNHNSLFSNMIITNDYVLLFTNDYQEALLYNDKDIIKIHDDFYQKDEFIKYYASIIQMQQQYLKNNQGSTYYYFTLQGLQYFCDTGYFHDLPQSLIDPLTSEEILIITKRWREFVNEYPYVIMLDIPAFPANSTLTITFDNGHLLFTCINAKGIPVSVKLNETSIYVAFEDYFHHVIDNHTISKNEAVRIIDEYIAKIEKKLV